MMLAVPAAETRALSQVPIINAAVTATANKAEATRAQVRRGRLDFDVCSLRLERLSSGLISIFSRASAEASSETNVLDSATKRQPGYEPARS